MLDLSQPIGLAPRSGAVVAVGAVEVNEVEDVGEVGVDGAADAVPDRDPSWLGVVEAAGLCPPKTALEMSAGLLESPVEPLELPAPGPVAPAATPPRPCTGDHGTVCQAPAADQSAGEVAL